MTPDRHHASLWPQAILGALVVGGLALLGAAQGETARQKAANAQIRTLAHGFQAAFLVSVLDRPGLDYPESAELAWVGACQRIAERHFPRAPGYRLSQSASIELPAAAELPASQGANLGLVRVPAMAPRELRDWGAMSYRATRGGQGYLIGGTLAVGPEAQLFLVGGGHD